MIEELPSRRLVYRFTHELVRRALYDRLTGLRRAELHLRVGEALEQRRRSGPGGPSPTSPTTSRPRRRPGGPSAAVDYNVRAARAATAALAFDEAAARLRTALELGIEPAPRQRGDVQLELGAATHRAGDAHDAIEAFSAGGRDRARAGGRAAPRAGRDRLRGRVLAAGHRRPGRRRAARGGGGRAGRRALRAARRAARRARARARLPGRARARRRSSATSAMAMARRLDDRHGLATMLMRAYWARGASSSRRSSSC